MSASFAFAPSGKVLGSPGTASVGWSAFVDSPILGHGPEGYVLVAHRHLDEQYVQDYGRDVAIDRAHQGLLDIGLAHGAIGIVAYLVLLCLMVRALWQHADHVATPIVAALVGYLVLQQGLFVVAEIDALWWLLAGSVVVSSRRREAAPDGVAQVQEDHQPTAAAYLLKMNAILRNS